MALIGWILLIVAPRWKWTRLINISGILPLLFALIYLMLIVSNFGNSDGGFGSLAQVSLLFENPLVLLGGWVHYLAFDLWTGCWELSNSQKLGINHFMVIPCLILTFMLGPIGLLLYFIIRSIVTKKIIHENF